MLFYDLCKEDKYEECVSDITGLTSFKFGTKVILYVSLCTPLI